MGTLPCFAFALQGTVSTPVGSKERHICQLPTTLLNQVGDVLRKKKKENLIPLFPAGQARISLADLPRGRAFLTPPTFFICLLIS